MSRRRHPVKRARPPPAPTVNERAAPRDPSPQILRLLQAIRERLGLIDQTYRIIPGEDWRAVDAWLQELQDLLSGEHSR